MSDVADSSPIHPLAALLRSRVAWFAVALIVFLGFIGRAPITTDHERRVAKTAQTMAHSGWPWAATPLEVALPAPHADETVAVNPWLVPVFDNAIRLQKPPLPYWCAATLDRLFGDGPGSARFVPALLGACSSLLVYQLGRRVGGRNVGLVAMIAWTSTHFVVDEFRKSMADPYLAAFTLAAIVAWIESSFATTRRRAAWSILAFYVALAFALLGKGPPVFLHLVIAIGAFAFSFRRWPRAAWPWHIVGVVICAALCLPWAAYILRNVPDVLAIWRNELDADRNPRPFFFYLHSPFLMSLPWVYAWIASLALMFLRKAQRRRLAFAHVWLFATMFVFSFAHMKKNAYLLPASPAIAIAAAQAAVRGIAFARRGRKPHEVRWVAWGHTIAGLIVAGVIAALTVRQHAASTPAAIGVAIVAVGIALLPLLTRPASVFGSWLAVQGLAFAVLILLFIAFPEATRPDRTTKAAPTSQPAAAAPIG